MTELTKEDMIAGATLPVFEFWVQGVYSLLMNNPQGMKGGPQEKLGRKKIPTPEEEAAMKVYRMEDDALYLPSAAFRSALLTAATNRKVGKTAATSILRGTVFNVDSKTPLVDPHTGELITTYDVNISRAVVQGNGVMRARPEVWPWGARVFLEIDDEGVAPSVIEEIFRVAGRAVGVGDWRPGKTSGGGKGGPHGRFRVDMVGEVSI
jgi:hypothetical protein